MRANGVTRWFRIALVLGSVALVATSCAGSAGRESVRVAAPAGTTSPCALNAPTEAITGAHGTASAIGWAGNYARRRHVPRRPLLRAGRHRQGVRLRHLRRRPDHVGRRRRLPPRADHQLSTAAASASRSPSSPTRSWSAATRTSRCTPRRGRRTRPNGVAVADPFPSPDSCRSRPRPTASRRTLGGARLRDRGRPVRRSPTRGRRRAALAAAGQLRPALRAHARVLERAARARSRRCTCPTRQLNDAYRSGFIYTQIARSGIALEHRRQQLRGGVQPRRHRHPGQPLHAGRLRRRARAAARRARSWWARPSTSTGSGRTRGRGPSTC